MIEKLYTSPFFVPQGGGSVSLKCSGAFHSKSEDKQLNYSTFD
jgi:hypothetical protein